ncbi:MAG: hypothetical protein IJJ30_06130 [Erysipelotrichaceae bacterium]|nr:hypothetical protein [Erysipelotrichaceae bacterium]
MRSKFLSIFLAALLLFGSLPAGSIHVYGDENTPATPGTGEVSETPDPEKETAETADIVQEDQPASEKRRKKKKPERCRKKLLRQRLVKRKAAKKQPANRSCCRQPKRPDVPNTSGSAHSE